MAIYEFRCPECGSLYEHWYRNEKLTEENWPVCECGAKYEKLLSKCALHNFKLPRALQKALTDNASML